VNMNKKKRRNKVQKANARIKDIPDLVATAVEEVEEEEEVEEVEVVDLEQESRPVVDMIITKLPPVKLEEPSEENWEDEDEEVLEKLEDAFEEAVEQPQVEEESKAPIARTRVKGFINKEELEDEVEVNLKVFPAWVYNNIASFYNEETGHPSMYATVENTSDGLYVGYVEKGVKIKNRPNCWAVKTIQEIPSGAVKKYLSDVQNELNLEASQNVDMMHMSASQIIARLLQVQNILKQDFKDLISLYSWTEVLEEYQKLKFIGVSQSGKNITYVFQVLEDEDN
jgi:hypothetical protein